MLFLPMLTWLATLVTSPFLQHATFFSASSRPLQLLITLQGGHFSESGSFLSFRDLCPMLLSQRNCLVASYSVFHYQLFPFIGHCSFSWQHLSHEVDPSFIDLFLPLSWVKVQWRLAFSDFSWLLNSWYLKYIFDLHLKRCNCGHKTYFP